MCIAAGKRLNPSASAPLSAPLLLGALLITGCSSTSSTSKVQILPITFTDANGTALPMPPTSLTAGQSSYVEVQLGDDPQSLGANWSVYCGSALPPGTPLPPGQLQDTTCGSFTPAHTMSGPVPSFVTSGTGYVTLFTAPTTPPKQGVVTLYASAASNPGRVSSTTLTIVGLPIAVGLAPAPPATLTTGAAVSLRAIVTNDTANAGVKWTVVCGSSDCGSFASTSTTSGMATTYTAPTAVPTGGMVQVTATSVADPTKAASATIAITGS